MAKKRKYLIDTSAVRPTLGESTPAHCAHFREQIADGDLWTSHYVRMEFMRLWFCEVIQLAIAIDYYDDVGAALIYLEQDFSQRSNKAIIAAISAFLRQIGPLKNTKQATEECASLALGWLAKFDQVFPRRTQNACGCQLGGRVPAVDYDHLLRDLRAFYVEFQKPITDCEVNAFLGLDRATGKAQPLLDDEAASKVKVVGNLQKFQSQRTHITCTECKTIGDPVIVLDTAPSWTLVHTDDSINTLYDAASRKHKQIQSARAFDKELYKRLHPKPPE